MPEPVTPELALVDPELRARVRATGPVTDCLAPRPRAAPASHPPESRAGSRLWSGLLVVSLLANAVFLASAWTGGHRAPAPAPSPTLGAGLGATGATGAIGSAVSSGVRSGTGGAVFVPQTPPQPPP